MLGEGVKHRVALFLDWQNVYRGAREAFGLNSKFHTAGQIYPVTLANGS
jgi:hypothetical protein